MIFAPIENIFFFPILEEELSGGIDDQTSGDSDDSNLKDVPKFTETRKVTPLKIKRAQISGSITASPPPLQSESREWKPPSQLFKPLSSGWVREVIYDKNEDGSLYSKAKEVIYHAPIQSGTEPKTFKSQAELKPFRKIYLFFKSQWARKFKTVQAKKLVKSNK